MARIGPQLPIWESFVLGQLQRVRTAGALPWSENYEHPVTGITVSERQALRQLVERGKLETAYDDRDNLVIRERQPEAPKPSTDLPYVETPALLAMRARRRALGR